MTGISSPSDAPVNGSTVEGFEPVQALFARQIANGDEIGASFAVVHRGRLVVDLWGGYKDEARSVPLGRSDLFNLWSTAKGLSALCVAIAADRGLLDYDRPVADYWPEFAVQGKSAVTVGMLLSHASGVNGPVTPATIDEILDLTGMADRLAAQAPQWEPGTASAYNANILGHWCDGLLRRTDGRGLGQFFREEVAGPLGADVWIGLPHDQHHRRSPMIAPWAGLAARMPLPADPLARISFGNPRGDPLDANRPDFIAADHGSAGGSGNAAGLAKIYGALAQGGVIDGVRVISRAGLEAATALQREGKDRVLGVWTRWAAGFLLSNRGLYGSNQAAFGHSGWGGSYAFADPASGVAMAYAMNLMAPNLSNDPRGRALMDASFNCLDTMQTD
jgi:CubicO group peptidase (beta-lactamase class C family)